MNQITLASHAKINLSLRILGKRPDGFHELTTRLCKIALRDRVFLSRGTADEATVLTCDAPSVPVDESNLALRALRAFEQATGFRSAWRIHLEKQIPAGAGLGGGSSNAAAVLRGLNQLCGHHLPDSRLIQIAAEIGSDVPFFLLDQSAAIGTGRGEIVTPVAFPWQLPLVLIKPPFPIPTPWAYHRWAVSRELPGVVYAPQLCPWGEMVNDLERPVFEKHLLLAMLKSRLLESGLTVAALMSGSGSTMFAVARSAVVAEEIADQARDWCGPAAFVKVTHTLPLNGI
ncbi:MAG: 4-(cytidine 5'-diphospho)-2-C-methyl-D-erythritol kinase [Verrucomicrobiaceae bacterium]|nr:4-(cytidine 5'-diphospho)-2-C-methyl-D-erythritol kinase [Verrucomicrobiaceae bacterium]